MLPMGLSCRRWLNQPRMGIRLFDAAEKGGEGAQWWITLVLHKILMISAKDFDKQGRIVATVGNA